MRYIHSMNAVGGVERRQATRFTVALPVGLENGTGITRDVSISGVFFETERPFAVGEPLRFALVIECTSCHRRVRLRCQGEVVRVEQLAEKMGIAVAFTLHGLEM